MKRATVPDETVTQTRVDVMAWLDQRFAALQAHRTEIPETSPFFLLRRLPEDALRELGGTETFILRESRIGASLPETDLFAGLG